MAAKFIFFVIMCLILDVAVCTYDPAPEIGVPAGFIPECPGFTRNVTISSRTLPKLQLVLHRKDEHGLIQRQYLPVTTAAKTLAKDKYVDLKNKKTIIYACGYLESSRYPSSIAIGTALHNRGYNVMVTDTFGFVFNYYPAAVRIAREIGKKFGEMLVNLTDYGLKPENLELVGASLGAHIMGYAAKYFYQATGKKPSRITGLDPAGPCFRSMPEEYRLNKNDAERVDIMHTNIDGFGMANRMGHVDIYANGGEFQPGDIPFIPCFVACSHGKSFLYYLQAVLNPKMFIAVQCKTVQDARFHKCYNSTVTNYFGLETNFSKPGIYYLSTSSTFPYYRGKEGLKAKNEIFTHGVRSLVNADDNIVL